MPINIRNIRRIYLLRLKIPFILSQASLPNNAIEIRNRTSPEIIRKVVAAAISPLEISINGSAAITPQATNDKTKQTYPNNFFKLMILLYSHNAQ